MPHPTSFHAAPASARAAPRVLTSEDHARWAPLVRRTAMRVARRAPEGIDVAALCKRGFVGLLEGLASAEAMAPGEPAEAYVEHRVREAMIDFIRAASPRVREARRASRELARALTRLRERGEPHAGDDDIARELALSPAAYEDLLAAVAKAGLARIDVVDFDADDDGHVAMPARASLAAAIDALPMREKNLLGLLYVEDVSFEEAAAILGTTQHRMVCLHTQIVHRLRAALGRE